MRYNTNMGFWSVEKIRSSIGEGIFHNFPEDWSATGLRIWHEEISDGDIILVRSQGETIGVPKAQIPAILDKVSAIMCTNIEEFRHYDKPIIEITNPNNAITYMGRYIRTSYKGKVISLTGSAGKSTTTKMFNVALKNYSLSSNLNQANTMRGICWNMTTFDLESDYWVIETSIGRGYVTVPDIAIITSLAPVHLSAGQTMEQMAVGKSKIFATMKPGSTAVINRDTDCYEIFEAAAQSRGLKIIRVGEHKDADVKLLASNQFEVFGKTYKFIEEFVPKHLFYNIGFVIAAFADLGLPVELALENLKDFKALAGRGETFEVEIEKGKRVTIVDESHNANPLSMTATIEAFAKQYNRNKVLIIGDMAEGGDKSVEYHLALEKVIKDANVDRILLFGKEMKVLWDRIKFDIKGEYYENVEKLISEYVIWLKDGDNVFIKSSHSTGAFRLIKLLKSECKKEIITS